MAVNKFLRLKWARKILNAKSFVVMTEKESMIALQGMDPHLLKDELALQEQVISLELFMRRLQEFKDEHMKAIDKLRASNRRQRRRPDAYEEIPFKKKGLDNGRKQS